MTAVVEIQGEGRTTFCRPVRSGALGRPHAGPYTGPGRLRTLDSAVARSPWSRGNASFTRLPEEAAQALKKLLRRY